MNKKVFNFENLTGNTPLIVTSVNKVIDFTNQCIRIETYIDNNPEPKVQFSELIIAENNLKYNHTFELKLKGTKIKIDMTSSEGLDLSNITVQRKH